MAVQRSDRPFQERNRISGGGDVFVAGPSGGRAGPDRPRGRPRRSRACPAESTDWPRSATGGWQTGLLGNLGFRWSFHFRYQRCTEERREASATAVGIEARERAPLEGGSGS